MQAWWKGKQLRRSFQTIARIHQDQIREDPISHWGKTGDVPLSLSFVSFLLFIRLSSIGWQQTKWWHLCTHREKWISSTSQFTNINSLASSEFFWSSASVEQQSWHPSFIESLVPHRQSSDRSCGVNGSQEQICEPVLRVWFRQYEQRQPSAGMQGCTSNRKVRWLSKDLIFFFLFKKQIIYLHNHSTVLALVQDVPMQLEVNCTFITELLSCLATNLSCAAASNWTGYGTQFLSRFHFILFSSIIFYSPLTLSIDFTFSFSNYVGVFQWRDGWSMTTDFIYRVLNATRPANSTVELHDAFSPAFSYDEANARWRLVDPEQPTWTES